MVQSLAAWALGIRGDTRAVAPLLAVLQDVAAERAVVASAAGALGELGDAQAVAPLLDLLPATDDIDVQCAVVDALGRLGDDRTLAALQDLVDGLRAAGARLSREARAMLEEAIKQATAAIIARSGTEATMPSGTRRTYGT
jgi:HEAT repeat protein